MPNYYVENEFFIDWSVDSVSRMANMTIADRKEYYKEFNKINKGDNQKQAAALRNRDKWFVKTLNFSPTGQYSPSFRIGIDTISQNTSSTIVLDEEIRLEVLSILSSKIAKYLFKNLYNHTVHTQEGDVINFCIVRVDKVSHLVENIIKSQKQDPQYDYSSHEQLEIDFLVAKAYGLGYSDILEIENWYARRYPKLVNAQKRNLKALCKPTDYIENYKLLVEKYGDLN